MLAASPAYRRYQFLRRTLGSHAACAHQKRMQYLQSVRGPSLGVDAENVLRAITPTLDSSKHKGQAGKVAVVGGCREYTGAPYFAAFSALRIGADLSHVFCTKDAAPVIKGYSPELIVHPLLHESYDVREEDRLSVKGNILAEIDKWMDRFDCIVVGPGLGRDPLVLDCVHDIIVHARQANVPIIVDGDGLFLITKCLNLIDGYQLAVLTPNVNEYKRLVEKVLGCRACDGDAAEQLLLLSKMMSGVTVLRKGKADLISDGETVKCVDSFGSPRRCGGQGDILSGSVAVFASWARLMNATEEDQCIRSLNPMLLASIAGSALLRKATAHAFDANRRATLTGDIIACLGTCLEDICPAI